MNLSIWVSVLDYISESNYKVSEPCIRYHTNSGIPKQHLVNTLSLMEFFYNKAEAISLKYKSRYIILR